MMGKRVCSQLRIKTNPANTEFKITGLSEKPCKEQLFSLKQKGGNENGEAEMLEVTVYDDDRGRRRTDVGEREVRVRAGNPDTRII